MTITIQQLVFYFFSSLAVLASCMVVAARNPVRAVLFLVFTFFSMAALWMLLEAEFLAIALVLVYVGAVMVLFLFVVMMLDIEAPKLKNPFVRLWPIGIVVALIMLGLMFAAIGPDHFGLKLVNAPLAKVTDYSNVKAIGTLLYTDFLFPFEIAGVILLVAMIAAIGLTFRGPRGTKMQKAAQQTSVRKEDRLTVINMVAEKEGKSE